MLSFHPCGRALAHFVCLVSFASLVLVSDPCWAGEDTTPPILRHSPVRTATEGASIDILATYEDASAIAFPRVIYRRVGEQRYEAVTMLAEDRVLRGSIPAFVVATDGVEYYIEAFDGVGNGPALHGSPDQPHRVAVVAPRLVETSPLLTSTWWFWTSLAVLLTGGITAGILASNRDHSADLTVTAPLPTPTLPGL